MANHVNTYIHFEKLNEAGVAKLNELYSRIRKSDEHTEWFSDLWGLDQEISNQYNWMTENVGPKWCYFEDRGDDFINLTSAWSYPQAGIEWLIEQLAEADPDVLAYVTYEDEMPNFFGCWFFDKNGIVDGCEWDDEEINEMMRDTVPELAELNEEEQSDEYWSLWGDNIWEMVSNTQYEVYQTIRGYLESE